jgi:antitoxin HicB
MTSRDYLKEPYTRVVIPDETGGFNAEILEFPGCFAQGDTVEEAYKELEDAAESWIEVRLSQGHEIPDPFSNLDYSGMISLRLPRSIHKRAAVIAERDRVSLNSFLMTAVASRIGAEDLYNALADRLGQHIAQVAFQEYNRIVVATEENRAIYPLKPTEFASTTGPRTSTASQRRKLVSARR